MPDVTDLCPYCAQPFSEGRPETRDHVFVKALGGWTQVQACRPCNSRIGSEIEGALQKPGELFHDRVLRGKLREAGLQVELDLQTGQLRSRNPVEVSESDGQKTYTISGNPEQVRQIATEIAHSLGIPRQQVDQHIVDAFQVPLEGEWIESTVSHRFDTGSRLAAKVALGAATLADSNFSLSTVASSLRNILWGESDVDARVEQRALAAYDEILKQHLSTAVRGIDSPLPGISRVVALPMKRGVAIFSFVGGHLAGLSGMVIEGTWEFLEGFPVVMTDAPGRLAVRRLADEIGPAIATMHGLI